MYIQGIPEWGLRFYRTQSCPHVSSMGAFCPHNFVVKLSSATPGVKNVLITYNDGDARLANPPPHLIHRMVEKAVQQNRGDKDDNGPGIMPSNKSGREESYFFYDNYWNGNGTAGANFDHPLKSVRLRPHTSVFVSLPDTFKGPRYFLSTKLNPQPLFRIEICLINEPIGFFVLSCKASAGSCNQSMKLLSISQDFLDIPT